MSSVLDQTFINELEQSLNSASINLLSDLISKRGSTFLSKRIAFNQDELNTPLTFAITNGETPCCIVEYLINTYPDLVNMAKDPPFECGPLTFAAMSDSRYDKAKLLVENGALVNVQDNQENTPLHHACNYGASKIVKLLLKHGANPEIRNKKGETAFGIAQDRKDPFVIRNIIEGLPQNDDSIEEEIESPQWLEVRRNKLDIKGIHRELTDMRRHIATLKEYDDTKTDQIEVLTRQNHEYTAEITSLKQNQRFLFTMLAAWERKLDSFERTEQPINNNVREMSLNDIIQSMDEKRDALTQRVEDLENEIGLLKERQVAYEQHELSTETLVTKNKQCVETLQKHQEKHEEDIHKNKTNIVKNELKIVSLKQTTRSIDREHCEFSSNFAIKLESLKRDTEETRKKSVVKIQPMESKLDNLVTRVDKNSQGVRSLDRKVEILEVTSEAQDKYIQEHSEAIQSIQSQTIPNPSLVEVADESSIPLVVERFIDGGSIASSSQGEDNGRGLSVAANTRKETNEGLRSYPNNGENTRSHTTTTKDETRPKAIRRSNSCPKLIDQTKPPKPANSCRKTASRNTPKPMRSTNLNSVTETELKYPFEGATNMSIPRGLSSITEVEALSGNFGSHEDIAGSSRKTKPLVHYGPEHPESNARQREITRQRPAYDDLQINDRVGSINNAVEYRTSRRRRWSGETKKVRECVTMNGQHFHEDARTFDIMEDFRNGNIRRRGWFMKIRRIDRATTSLSSIGSWCPPASSMASHSDSMTSQSKSVTSQSSDSTTSQSEICTSQSDTATSHPDVVTSQSASVTSQSDRVTSQSSNLMTSQSDSVASSSEAETSRPDAVPTDPNVATLTASTSSADESGSEKDKTLAT